MWFFALSIYFVTINEDLLMTAINGLVCNAALILLGSAIGNVVDKYQRINSKHRFFFLLLLMVLH